jgi:hypothetical protein
MWSNQGLGPRGYSLTILFTNFPRHHSQKYAITATLNKNQKQKQTNKQQVISALTLQIIL